MQKSRKIIHIDMDAFYASVEQRDNPGFRGRPVIVGGDPHKRGVVAACSYEARRSGIHSAMSSAKAVRLCPGAIFIPPRFDVYRKVSSEIMAIFHEYTDLVEPLSLDEAFLDVTQNKKDMVSATYIAARIRKEIYGQTRLRASAGVSYNKFLAKLASDFHKPDGLTVVTPQQARDFIDNLPIRKFSGVGRVTEKRMHAMGIRTGADLGALSRDMLVHHFGKAGRYFYDIANGTDLREVNPDRTRKSIGKEITLNKDIDDRTRMVEILGEIAACLEDAMKKHKIKGRTITLKLKYLDFQSITRGVTLNKPVDNARIIHKHITFLLADTNAGIKKVRLLGITISNLATKNPAPGLTQLILPIFQ